MKSQTDKYFDQTIVDTENLPGVDKGGFVVLMTGRCGSTWLTKLLDQTKQCGRVDEFFTEAFIPAFLAKTGPLSMDAYVGRLRKQFGYKVGFGFQIDPMRLAWLQGFSTTYFRNLFHSVGAVAYMTRRDLVSQAYSFARAKASGVWHVTAGQVNKDVNFGADYVDDSVMWEEMLSILHDEYWAERAFTLSGVIPYRLTYEDLVADAYQAISRLLIVVGRHPDGLIELGGDDSKDTKKIAYQAKDRVLVEFWQRYSDVVREVMRLRENASPLKDYFSLLDSNKVPYRREWVRWYEPPTT